MGIFKAFLGDTYIKGETMTPKLRVNLKNVKLFLGDKLRYQMPISGATTTCSTATYNGSTQIAQNISVVLSGQTLTNATDYTVTNNSGGVNAGSYSYTVSGINYFNSSVNGTFKINPKPVTPTITLSQTSYTYNGSQCKPTPTVKDGSTTIPSSEYTVSYSNNTNVGTATCTITDKSGGNYTVSGSKTFTINCYSATAPTAKSLTYNTSAQALVNAGSTDFGTMVYSTTSGGTFSETIPTGTNAGSYEVWWKVTGNTNVCNTAATKISVTISPKTVSSPTITLSQNEYTYANTAFKPTPTVKDGSTTIASSEYTVSYSDNTNVGTATCTITDKSGGNYTVSGYKTFTINCYSATAPTAKSLNWTGSAQALVNAGSTDFGTMVYNTTSSGTFSETIPTGTNAGDYEVWWKVTGNTNVCNTAATKVACTINKVAMTYVAPKAATRTYTGSAQQIVSGASATGGAIYYATSSAGASSSTTVPTQTAAGTYSTYWRAVPDSNHSGGTSWAQITGCVINKANPTYTAPKATTYTYNGSERALLSGASTSHGEIQYSTSETGTYSVSIPTQTNAGTYTTWWKLIGDSNHNDVAATSISTTISKAAGSVTTAPTKKTLTYDNTDQALVNAGSGTGTMLYKVGTGSWGTSIPTGKAAGDYTVYYKASASTNYNESASGSVACSIAKVTPTVTAPKPCGLTYNGNAQNLVSGGSTNWGTLQYSLDNSTWGTNIPQGTNATSYTVYYKVVGNSNINDVAAQSVSVTIAKANPTYTAPTKKTGLEYNGSAQNLLNAGSTSHGTIQYSSNGSTWSTTIPQGTNASSTYKAYWRLVGDSNHKDVASTEISSISIAKVTPTVTAPTAKVLTYNGSAQALVTAGSTNFGTLVYSTTSGGTYSTTIPSGTNAGSYEVWYKVNGDSNVNSTTATKVDCSIAEKRVTTPTITLDPTSYTYNGSAQIPTTVTVKDGTTVIPSSEYNVVYSNNINAGTATVTITDKDAGNYYISGTTAFTISRVTPTVNPLPTAKSLTYNGSEQTLANAGSTNFGSLQYSTSEAGTYSTTVPKGTNAGDYEVWYKVVGDSNVNSTNPIKVSCSIAKATGTATIAGTTNTYNNTAKNLISVSNNTGTMHYKVDSGGWSTTLPQATNAGSWTIYYYMDASTNYTARGSSGSPWGNVTSTINKVTPTVTAPTKKSLTYNGSAQELYNAGSTNWGTIQYCATSGGTYTTAMIKGTNAGSYDCWYKVVGNDNIKDVAPAKASGTTIAVLAGSISYGTTSVTKTYGDAAFTNTLTKTGDGTVTYSSNNTTVATVNTSGQVTIKQAGSATITATVANTSNTTYATKTATYTLTVNKAPGSVTTKPTAKSLTWTGSAQALVNAGSGTGTMMYKLGSGSWGTSIPSATNATSYTVYYKASASTNYEESTSGSVSVTINKKTGCAISFSTTSVSKTYGDAAFTNAITNNGDGSLTWGSSNTTIATVASNGQVTIKQAGSCTISATTTSTTNCTYSTTAASYSLSVAKAPGSVKTAPTAKSLNWTGSAQALVNAGASDTGTMLYKLDSGSWGTSIPTATNAGSYTVYYKASASTNYEESTSGSVSCSIAKVAMTYSAPKAAVRTYNGSAQQIVSGQSAAGGSIYYATSSAGASSSTTVPTQTNTGTTYSTYWKAVPDSNHSGGTSSWAQITGCTINKATLTITAKAQTVNYGTAITQGTGQTTTSGLVSGDALTAITLTQSTTNVPGGTITPSAGATTKGIANYSVTYNTGTLTINKKTGCTISFATTSISKTYGNAAFTNAITNTGDGSITWGSSNTTIATVNTSGQVTIKQAGSCTISATTTSTTNCTYSTTAASYSLSVAKANISPTVSISDWNYGGTASNPSVAGNSGSGTVVYYYKLTSASSWSTTKPSAAGNYDIKAEISATTNYNSGSCTSTFTINKVAMTYTAPSAATRTYNSSAQQIVSGQSAGGGSIYYATSSAGASSSTTVPTQTNIGTYSTYWKAVPDGNHSGGTSSWTQITNCKINCYTASAPTNKNPNWTGSAQAYANAGSTAYGTMVYCSTSGGTFTTSLPTATNAGNYECWYKVSGNTNVCPQAATKVACTIAKVAMSYTAPSAATRTYNGSAQQIVSGGSANGGSIYYATSSAGASSSTTVPTQTNANTNYSTYWKAVPDSNHSGGTSSWTQITGCKINKCTPVLSTSPTKVSDWTYDGSAHNLLSGGAMKRSSSDATAVAGTFTYDQGTNAGTYTNPKWYFTPTDTTNYNSTNGTITATINVSKANPTIVEPTKKANLVYNRASQTLYDAGSNTTPGSFSYSNGTRTNAGDQTVSWSFTPTDTNNYNSKSGSFTGSIAKATPVLATSPTYVSNWTYDATAHNLLTGGSMKHSSSDSTAVAGSLTYDQGTNVGTYSNKKWYFTPTDATNYNSTNGTVTGSVTCNCKPCTAPTAKSLTYNGSAQSLVNGGSTTYGTMVYSTSSTGTFNTTIPTGTNAGSYEVWWKVTGNTNVCCTAATKVACSIAKKAISIPTPTGVSRAYNGSAATATFPAATGAGITKYRYSTNGSSWTESSTNPSQTNAGTLYTQAYYSANNDNYSGAGWSSSATIAISKADQNPPTATGATVCYGNTATASASGGGQQGSIEWSNGNSRTAVGTTSTAARWSGNSNYNASSYSSAVNLTVTATWCSGTTWLGTLTWPSA